ncbi:MAG: hypothetical protein RJA61_517 [Candidatus Parcubacteria bacterium]|jgi:cell shape-determining protein MreC
MNYVLKSRNHGRGVFFRKISKAGALVGVLLLISFFIPTFFSSAVFKLFSEAWNFGNAVDAEASLNTGFFSSKEALILENKALKELLAQTTVKEIAYQALYDEYTELKSSLGGSADEGSILAGVIAHPPRIAYDNIIIDIGLAEGVRVGDVVFADGVVALGTVVDVYDSQSKVELYSTPERQTVAFISRTGVQVDLVGRGGGDFEIVVPREASVVEGDIFVTAGATGFVTARARVIDSRPTDAFQNVLAEVPVNIQNIRWVTLKKQ